MRNHSSAASSVQYQRVPSEHNDPITIEGVNSWGSEKCSQDQNQAWDNVTDVVTARRLRTTKQRFREKLKTKKCRDTQYRHIIVTEPVTIVTLPVGLSATDQLPSDWSTQHFLGLWLAPCLWYSWHSWQYSKSYLTLSQLTKCHGNPEFYAECWGLSAWHFLSSSVFDWGHWGDIWGIGRAWLMAPSEDNYPQIVFTRSSSQHNRLQKVIVVSRWHFSQARPQPSALTRLEAILIYSCSRNKTLTL